MQLNVTFDQIYEAYVDCAKHKKSSKSFVEFDMHRQENLIKLKNDLNNGTYEIGRSICFIVTDPKPREVFAADFRDRIVHHLIIKKFNYLFESHFIDESFNCRVGKGTMKGIDTLQEFVRIETDNFQHDCWILKCDIRNFFMSISKTRLAGMLEDFIRSNYYEDDVDDWVELIKMVALNQPQINCIKKGDESKWYDGTLSPEKSMFFSDPDNGLAVGNLTSQIFANFFLSAFDHFMKSFKKARYGRYVDDFFAVSKDKNYLLHMMKSARDFLKDNLNLTLHEQKWSLQLASKGVQFLGNIVKLDKRYVIDRTFNNGMRAAKNTKMPLEKYVSKVNSYLGFLKYLNAYHQRRKIWKAIPESMKKYVYGTTHLFSIKIKRQYTKKQMIIDKIHKDNSAL